MGLEFQLHLLCFEQFSDSFTADIPKSIYPSAHRVTHHTS